MEGNQRVPDVGDAPRHTPHVNAPSPPPAPAPAPADGEDGAAMATAVDAVKPARQATPVPPSPVSKGVEPSHGPSALEPPPQPAVEPPAASAGFTPVHVAQSTDSGELLACPVCCAAMSEPFMTACGHTFCHTCITAHLQRSDACPMCRTPVAEDGLRPNHAMRALVSAGLAPAPPERDMPRVAAPLARRARVAELAAQAGGMDDAELDALVRTLRERRAKVREDTCLERHALLVEFLARMREHKLAVLAELRSQVGTLDADLAALTRVRAGSPVLRAAGSGGSASEGSKKRASPVPAAALLHEAAASKRARVHALMPHLEEDYFARRERDPSLTPFATDLHAFARVGALRVVSHVARAPPAEGAKPGEGGRTITSIRFDKEAQLFATAGARRSIKVYDFAATLDGSVARHYPLTQLETAAGVSALCWSPYIRAHLTSCDYLGNMHLWNTQTGQLARQFVARKRRVWAVDISRADPMALASASADGVVCLWNANHSRPIAELAMPTKAHVCGVSFHPTNATQLLCASADHLVRLFDLRRVAEPLHVYAGHRKAVSDVRWVDEHEFVSASTDSTIRVWDASTHACVATHGGHRNDRHFVGLDACDGYLACGSETNEAHVFTRGLRTPLLSHALAPPPPPTDTHAHTVRRPFVSAVCWNPHTRHLLAGNSAGHVQVLKMGEE